jgi:hypothetical protein
MRIAIKLDNQFAAITAEIHNKRPKSMLPAESQSIQLVIAQM